MSNLGVLKPARRSLIGVHAEVTNAYR